MTGWIDNAPRASGERPSLGQGEAAALLAAIVVVHMRHHSHRADDGA
ncbi:MAG TPA: hypothetical protein VGF95_09125 [Solirubrobacteraceae bacterium]